MHFCLHRFLTSEIKPKKAYEMTKHRIYISILSQQESNRDTVRQSFFLSGIESLLEDERIMNGLSMLSMAIL